MAADYARAVRVEVIEALKVAPFVIALVDPEAIYPATVTANPAWPFVRYGAPITSPYRLSGLDSSSVRGSLHAFAKPLNDDSGSPMMTAEDHAMAIGEALARAIDGRELVLDGGMVARLGWTGTTALMDGDEADAWHAVVSFTAEVAG